MSDDEEEGKELVVKKLTQLEARRQLESEEFPSSHAEIRRRVANWAYLKGIHAYEADPLLKMADAMHYGETVKEQFDAARELASYMYPKQKSVEGAVGVRIGEDGNTDIVFKWEGE